MRPSECALVVAACVVGPALANDDGGADSIHPPLAAAGAAPRFGSALPTEHFVQSFQEKVTQQLQEALEQARRTRDDRLQGFEKRQDDLGEQLRAIQSMLSSRTLPAARDEPAVEAAPARPEAGPGSTVLPPVINSRRLPGAEPPRDPIPPSAATGIPGLVGNLLSASASLQATAASADAALAPPGSALLTAAPERMPVRMARANIAPHGFVEGRMLNGVVAREGGPERESIVALSGAYQSANSFRTNLDGCFALVQGRPDLSASRIDFKLSRLTCNFPDGGSTTWDAAGWLVDRDGIRGIKAVVVDHDDHRMLLAAGAGALASLTGGAGVGPGVADAASTDGSAGAMPAARDVFTSAVQGAAASAQEAVQTHVDRYVPSLQVGGGTAVTIVLANELLLPFSGAGQSPTHTTQP